MISFANVDTAGNIDITTGWSIPIAAFQKLKTPTSKVLLAVGGQTAGTWGFSQTAASATARANFASQCLNILTKYNFDGIDIDWEFPTNAQRGDFVKLHQDLKAK